MLLSFSLQLNKYQVLKQYLLLLKLIFYISFGVVNHFQEFQIVLNRVSAILLIDFSLLKWFYRNIINSEKERVTETLTLNGLNH